MDVREIALGRLSSQQIAQARFEQPGEVMSWLMALQGQDYAGAKWSLGLRLPKSTEAEIEKAIEERVIVRTWAMRGTLHLLTAEDAPWLVSLLSARLISSSLRRNRELELDEDTLKRSSKLLAQAVEGGLQRTRTELFSILQKDSISTSGQRGIYMLYRASLEGLLCQSVMRGRDPLFFAFSELPTKAKSLKREEALAEFATRYFASRGPATLQDFAWWSGLTMKEARAGLEAVSSKLEKETINGQTYWFSPAEIKMRKSSEGVFLLPGFDEYLLSYKDRSASLDDPHYKRGIPLNGMMPSTIVSAGRVIGTWKRTFKKNAVMFEINPFREFTGKEKDNIGVAAERYADFMGMEVAKVNKETSSK
jgi:hypothetical protein